MDKSTEQEKRRAANNAAWSDTIRDFVELREKFPTLDKISLNLPFGLLKKPSDPTGKLNNLVYEPYMESELSPRFYREVSANTLYPMSFEHKLLPRGRKVLLLKQAFDTTPLAFGYRRPVKGESVFNPEQVVRKNSGYYYRWTFKGQRVIISKMIGTTKMNQLKQQAKELVKECQRFIFLYCQG